MMRRSSAASDDALVVPASLPPLRNDGIDLQVRGFPEPADTDGQLIPHLV